MCVYRPASTTTHLALVFGFRLIGVRDLKSVIVDNGWNRDRQEPKVSLARGKAILERLAEWFLN